MYKSRSKIYRVEDKMITKKDKSLMMLETKLKLQLKRIPPAFVSMFISFIFKNYIYKSVLW